MSKLLASERWCKGTNAPFIRRLFAAERITEKGHWLGLVLCVSISASMLMSGQQGRLILRSSLLEQVQDGNPKGNRMTQVHLEKRLLNRSKYYKLIINPTTGPLSRAPQWWVTLHMRRCYRRRRQTTDGDYRQWQMPDSKTILPLHYV